MDRRTGERGRRIRCTSWQWTLLERNRKGDLDYKSISKLYDLEAQFGDPEYSQIMQLFKESNVVNGTAINFYFHQRDERGVWHRIEPSFNRM